MSIRVVDVVSPLVEAIEIPGRTQSFPASSASVVGMVLHEARKSGYEASVPEIGSRLGISRRTIEYAFREHLAVSPHATSC